MKNKFRNILLYVSIIVFFCSIIYIVYSKYTMNQDQQQFEKLQEAKENEVSSSLESNSIYLKKNEDAEKKPLESQNTDDDAEKVLLETESINREKSILPEYDELYQENQDLYGWIEIEDTVINYPVMYTPNNPNFYLRRNWNKEYSVSGCIFIDGRSNGETENIIIYGHNMDNETMFGTLNKYKEKEYYQEHKYIQFDTIYEKAIYEIIAVSKAIAYNNVSEGEYSFYNNIELNSKEKFNEYISFIKENSYYEIESNTEYGCEIITLCTCDYWADNARLLVVAKKIK